MKYESYKGVKDFNPQEYKIKEFIEDKWSNSVESFGYQRYDASILERSELYTEKTNDEIVKEQSYTFQDRGGRNVTLRPEMTPTVARMVGQLKQEKKFYAPLRWYSISNLFRYESVQKGRSREHWQLNADLFGVNGIEGTKEILKVLMKVFDSFGLSDDIEIIVNDKRNIINIFDKFNLSKDERIAIQRAVDKKGKIPNEEWETGIVNLVNDGNEILKEFNNLEETKDIKELKKSLPFPISYNQYLIRGFDYYTDIIFEVFAKESDVKRSLAGGGHWDLSELVGVPDVNAVGFGLGNVTLLELLKEKNKLPKLTELLNKYIYVTTKDKNLLNFEFIDKLISANISVAVDYTYNPDRMKRKAEFDGVSYLLIMDRDDFKLIEINTNKTIEVKNAEEIINLICKV